MGKLKYLIITLAVVFAMVAALLAYRSFGCSYSGTEFSPDDFSVRQFSYGYDPIMGSVVRGRTFDPNFYQYIMPDLVGNKYIQPIFKKKKTWHLIEDNGAYQHGYSADSDAHLLVDFLCLKDENGENKWTVWNSDHPKLAKIFWPLIAEMAQDEIYLTVGDVLTFALDGDHSKPKRFKADLREKVAEAYLKLGRIDFQNSDLESAEYRTEKSIKFHSNPEAKSLLEKIRSAEPTAEEPMSASE